MKIVGILGSPRKGNSSALFEAFSDGASANGAHVESIWLKDLKLAACRACEACFKTGMCVVEDDFRKLTELIDSADVLVLATPIHFGGPSAHMTKFFSRCQQYFGRKYVIKQRDRPHARRKGNGVLIATSAVDNPDYFECVRRISGYVLTTLDFARRASLWVPDMEGPDDARRNPEVLKKARRMGELVAQRKWEKLEW